MIFPDSADAEFRKKNIYGKPLQQLGGINHSYINIKRLWGAFLPHIDHLGVVAGSNDSSDWKLGGGGRFELAYYVYRDPELASILKLGGGDIGASQVTGQKPSKIIVDVSKLNGKWSTAFLGGDFLPNDRKGSEGRLPRKTHSTRVKGKTAGFLTAIEPFEDKSVLAAVNADSEDQLTVSLKDGRVHKYQVGGFHERDGKVKVTMTEMKDGKVLREEESINSN